MSSVNASISDGFTTGPTEINIKLRLDYERYQHQFVFTNKIHNLLSYMKLLPSFSLRASTIDIGAPNVQAMKKQNETSN